MEVAYHKPTPNRTSIETAREKKNNSSENDKSFLLHHSLFTSRVPEMEGHFNVPFPIKSQLGPVTWSEELGP